MKDILREYNITSFTLMPIVKINATLKTNDDKSIDISGNSNTIDSDTNHMKSTDLGCILENALTVARRRQEQNRNEQKRQPIHDEYATGTIDHDVNSTGHVIFLGMDSPEIPLHEIIRIVQCDNHYKTSALLLPSDDGGYGMIAIPYIADATQTFNSGIIWSDPLTALSQIKALTDQSILVIIGPVMYDIDTPDDVRKLCHRIQELQQPQRQQNNATNYDLKNKNFVLSRPSRLAQENDEKSACKRIIITTTIETQYNDDLAKNETDIDTTDNIVLCSLHNTYQALIRLGIIRIEEES